MEPTEGADGHVVDLGIDGVEDAIEIGRGGFGVVYKATETELGRSVAVKVLSNEVDEQARNRFDRERRAMGALSGHPHIVNVFHTGVSASGSPYIVMEYLSGGTMTDQLRRNGAVPWADTLVIGVQLASALETAHRAGVLHRDVKPSNVLLDAHDTAKLGDFGIARLHGGPETKSAMITASIAHAPPEVISGQRPDARSDVYSLASTMFQLLTGTPAFSRATDESLVPMFARIASEPIPNLRASGTPDAVADVMEKAMAKLPDQRFATAIEFGRALNRCQQRLGMTPTPLMVEGEPSLPQPNRAAATTTIQRPTAAPAPTPPRQPAPTPAPTSAPTPQSPPSFPAPEPHPRQVGPAPTPVHASLTPPQPATNTNLLIGGGIAAAIILLAGVLAFNGLRDNSTDSANSSTTTEQNQLADIGEATTTTTAPTTTTTIETTTTVEPTTTLPPPPPRPFFAANLPLLPEAEIYDDYRRVTPLSSGFEFRAPRSWGNQQNLDEQVFVSPFVNLPEGDNRAIGGVFVSASKGFGVFDGPGFLALLKESLETQDECTTVDTIDYELPLYSGLLEVLSCEDQGGPYAAMILVTSNQERDVYLISAGEAVSEADLLAVESSFQSIRILDKSLLPDFSQ